MKIFTGCSSARLGKKRDSVRGLCGGNDRQGRLEYTQNVNFFYFINLFLCSPPVSGKTHIHTHTQSLFSRLPQG